MRHAVPLALSLCLASPAQAGPWLRDADDVFLSFGGNIALRDGTERPVHHDPALFLEWGLTERLTVAAALHSSDAGLQDGAELHALTALPLPEGWGTASLSFGVVWRNDPEAESLMLATGLAYGHGWPEGWASVELRVLNDPKTGAVEGKLDLTYGVHLSPDWSAMVQVQTGHGADITSYARLHPAAIYRLTDNLRVTGGVMQALTGDRGTGLQLGLWLEF